MNYGKLMRNWVMERKIRKYSRRWFIQKFEAIPEEEWGCMVLDNGKGKKCALGHCGMKDYLKPTKEALSLLALMGGPELSVTKIRLGIQVVEELDYRRVYIVNDENFLTPKANVINFLRNL